MNMEEKRKERTVGGTTREMAVREKEFCYFFYTRKLFQWLCTQLISD